MRSFCSIKFYLLLFVSIAVPAVGQQATTFSTLFKEANSCRCSPQRKAALYTKAIEIADAGNRDALDTFNYGEAFNRRGEAYKKMNAWDQAAADFKKAYELKGGDIYIRFKWAHALAELGELKVAESEMHILLGKIRKKRERKDILNVEALDALLAKSLFNLGVIELQLQKAALACDHFKKAWQLKYAPAEEAMQDFC